MKVKSVKADDTETSVTIDIFENIKVNESLKKKVAKEVGEYLVEQTLLAASQRRSPVEGGQWKKSLSPAYAKLKQKEVGNKLANLELSGQTLDSLDYKIEDGNIVLGVFGDRAPVLDGHNNLSGKSLLPERKLLPKKGEFYKSSISKEMEKIIADVIAENTSISSRKVSKISSTDELYDYLQSLAKVKMSRSELRLFALRNAEVVSLLEDNNILELL